MPYHSPMRQQSVDALCSCRRLESAPAVRLHGNLVHVILHSLLTRCCAAGGKVKRLAVDATLRTAAPYQKSRKARAEAAGKTRKVYVEKVHPFLSGSIGASSSVCLGHHTARPSQT
jgi:hypothetical protein